MYNNVNPAAGIGNAGGVLPAGGIQSQQGMNGAGSTFGNGAPPRQNFNMSNGVVPPAGPGAYPPPNGGSFNQQSGGGINGANLIQQPSGLSDPGPVPPSAPGAPYNSGPLAPPNPNAFGSGRN
jgi:hypothetical protein